MAPAPSVTAEVIVSSCQPSCRSGYTCVANQCVSICNPVCGAGERCTLQGECVAETSQEPPRLSFFANLPSKPPVVETGVHEHDGFMLRLMAGGGVGGGEQKGVDSTGSNHKTEMGGLVGSFSVDVGTTPYENLVLLLRASDIALRQPTVKVDGVELPSRGRAWIGAGFFGPGATYYLMPSNVYFTGTVGISWVVERGPSSSRAHTTDTGIGLNADIGKEWWIDPQWGIGIAGRLWYSRISDKSAFDHVEYQMAGATLLFSATYQ